MVSIAAIQAVDPGSIPGRRMQFIFLSFFLSFFSLSFFMISFRVRPRGNGALNIELASVEVQLNSTLLKRQC